MRLVPLAVARTIMSRAAPFLLLLVLCACMTLEKKERSPDYELGYSDGCASAAAQGPGIAKEPRRNEMLYAADMDYRAGWNSGNAQCRVQGPNRL